MADASQRIAALPAHSSKYVSPGQLGSAIYDSETQKWSFLRVPLLDGLQTVEGQILKPTIDILKDNIDDAGSSTSDLVSPKSDKHIAITSVLKEMPDAAVAFGEDGVELQPAKPSSGKSFSRSSILAFGSALLLGNDDIQSGNFTTPIAIYTSSGEPRKLLLFLINTRTVSIDAEESFDIRVPSLKTKAANTWSSDNGLILSAEFSDKSSRQGNTWLVIRQSSTVTIMQPLYHRSSGQSNKAIDPNVVLQLPMSVTGGSQQADVAFNPHDPHQLAVVDIAGNWSTWEIKGQRSATARNLYRAKLKSSGRAVYRADKVQQFDGWHRILWLNNTKESSSRLLVILNRRSMIFFDARTGALLCKREVQAGRRAEGWILDIVPGQLFDQFFVLTTTHIYAMSAANMALDQTVWKKRRQGPIVLAYWKHHRSPEDRALQIRRISFDKLTCLFLASALHEITTVYYHFHSFPNPDGKMTHFSISDPVVLPKTAFLGAVRQQSLSFRAVTVGHNPKSIQQAGSAMYFQMFRELHDGRIHPILYRIFFHSYTDTSTTIMTMKAIDAIPLPNNRNLQSLSAYRVIEDRFDHGLDDFIVPDDQVEFIDDANVPDVARHCTTKFLEIANSEAKRAKKIVSLDLLLGPLIKLAIRNYEDGDQSLQLRDFLQKAEHELEMLGHSRALNALVPHIDAGTVQISDIDLESELLNEWIHKWLRDLNRRDGEDHSKESSFAYLNFQEISFADYYDYLFSLYIESLSGAIPDRVRVRKERLLRRIAFETYLSSILLVPYSSNLSHPQVVNDGVVFGYTSPRDVAIHGEGSISTSPRPPLSSSQLQMSTNTDSLPMSAHSNDGHAATFESLANEMDEDTPQAVRDILAHLPASADVDPAMYSYDQVEFGLATARGEALMSQLGPKARRKAEKLANRQRKQLEKQARIKKAALETATMIPSISSSQLPFRAVQNSQAGPSGPIQSSSDARSGVGGSSGPSSLIPVVSMSQPERGAFGSSGSKKLKSKGKPKRQRGF